MVIWQIIGGVCITIGVIFCVLGVVGIIRLPDTYSRLHATGKTSTIGTIFICIGVGFALPGIEATLKLIALSIFLIFSSPAGSHAIAAAVHRSAARHNADEQHLVEVSGFHDIDKLIAETGDENVQPQSYSIDNDLD